MLYESAEDNFVYLIDRFGCLRFDQLAEFFDPVLKPDDLKKIVRNYMFARKMTVSEKGEISMVGGGRFHKEVLEAIQSAFWIVTNFGYEAIDDIWFGGNPMVICFTTVDGDSYDISYCSNDARAEKAARMIRDNGLIRKASDAGNEDPFVHICLVPFAEYGPRYKGYGFNNWCVIDKYSNLPSYTKYE